MRSAVREAVAPAYLLMCLVLGGSAQGVWSNMLLQLIGVAIIAWAAVAPAEEPLTRPARQLLWIALIGIGIVALQLVPLPASVWPHLGGREAIARGYSVLGLPVPALPLSLDPYSSIATLLTLIPAIALFLAIVRLRAYRRMWLGFALLAGTLAGVLVGVLQSGNADPSSNWYFYRTSNFGYAIGFFANANHMATLLVVALPFLAALLKTARGKNVQRYSAGVALAGAGALVIMVGIVLNRSLAGYALAVPVLAASALILLPGKSAARRWLMPAAIVLLAATAVALSFGPVGSQSLGAEASVETREEMVSTSVDAVRHFLPFGSGLGTFQPVYRLYEDHDRVTRMYINHAHNDYVELVLELGIPGVILLLLFFAWWGAAAWRAWKVADGGSFARAASIASAAILAHSVVDFPLRTAAISATFAMCLALLVVGRSRQRATRADLRPTRHVVLE